MKLYICYEAKNKSKPICYLTSIDCFNNGAIFYSLSIVYMLMLHAHYLFFCLWYLFSHNFHSPSLLYLNNSIPQGRVNLGGMWEPTKSWLVGNFGRYCKCGNEIRLLHHYIPTEKHSGIIPPLLDCFILRIYWLLHSTLYFM